jgi:hypothetical protein
LRLQFHRTTNINNHRHPANPEFKLIFRKDGGVYKDIFVKRHLTERV